MRSIRRDLASEMLGHADTELLLNVYGHASQERAARAETSH